MLHYCYALVQTLRVSLYRLGCIKVISIKLKCFKSSVYLSKAVTTHSYPCISHYNTFHLLPQTNYPKVSGKDNLYYKSVSINALKCILKVEHQSKRTHCSVHISY